MTRALVGVMILALQVVGEMRQSMAVEVAGETGLVLLKVGMLLMLVVGKQREVKAGVLTRKYLEEEANRGTTEEEEALIPAIRLRKRMFMTWKISRLPQLNRNRRNLNKYMGTDMKSMRMFRN